jgi:hypothetical protein
MLYSVSCVAWLWILHKGESNLPTRAWFSRSYSSIFHVAQMNKWCGCRSTCGKETSLKNLQKNPLWKMVCIVAMEQVPHHTSILICEPMSMTSFECPWKQFYQGLLNLKDEGYFSQRKAQIGSRSLDNFNFFCFLQF